MRRAWLLCLVVGLCDAAPVKSQEADGNYRLALEQLLREPADPNTTFRYASTAADAGDATGVVASLERLMVLEPRLSNLRFELGLLHLRVGATPLAERYLSEALADPSIPSDIRDRGLALLDSAVAANRRWRFSGYGAVGLRYDSNANAGADGVVQFVTGIGEVQGRLRPEDTGQPDYSATAYLSGEARYDLGFQAGHELVLPGALYGESYREQDQLNVAYANFSPGLDLNIASLAGRPARLGVNLFLARLARDGAHYLDEAGLFLDGAIRQAPAFLLRAGFSAKHQEFFDTDDAPLNDNRDGQLYGGFLGAVYDISERTQLSGELLGRRKTASADFEAYREYGAIAQVWHLFDAGGLSRHGLLQVGLSATYSVVDYDDLDLNIDLDTAQQDRRYRIEGEFNTRVSEDAGIALRMGYYRNQSNFAIREYDNIYVAIEIGKSF